MKPGMKAELWLVQQRRDFAQKSLDGYLAQPPSAEKTRMVSLIRQDLLAIVAEIRGVRINAVAGVKP